MKKLLATLLIFSLCFTFSYAEEVGKTTNPDISIVFTSDIHSNVTSGLSLSGVRAYANGLKDQGNYVEVVDCGDLISGNTLASISKGQYAVESLNLAGYGLATLGSSDFDYGAAYLITDIAKEADYTYLSCNLKFKETNTLLFKPYVIKTYGTKKVAFVGISDTDLNLVSATDIKDATGKYYFSFSEGSSGLELYTAVQEAINSAKAEGADYVVAISHLSEDESSALSVKSVIKNTTGLNAVINGKTHSANSYQQVNDYNGMPVLLTNPGNNLKNIGVLTISPDKNTVSSQLVSSYNLRNVATKDAIDKLTTEYTNETKTAFATSSSKLVASDAQGVRVIESQETNLGDLIADAYKDVSGADIALVSASEIQTNIPLGSISYSDIVNAVPKGDGISVVKVTGLELMDILEMSSRLYPNRNANFLQVAGLTYDINETVPVSVSVDGNGNFVSVDGDYRVTNIYINGQPVDLLGTYTVVASNTLLNGTTGYTMFNQATAVKLNVTSDNQAVISYLTNSMAGIVGSQYAQSQKRIDSIKLARQSEIDLQVQNKVDSMLKEYVEEIAELKAQIEIQEKAIAIKSMSIKATTKFTKVSGKRNVKISWTPSETISGVKYQVYRSTKKTSGFKKVSQTSNKYLNNKASLTKGKTYYYKVRAYVYVGGKYYYSSWSPVVSCKITK